MNLALKNPAFSHVNLYHLANMLDTYLLLEPNVSCNHIIKHEMLSNLVENCHNPEISSVIYNLLEPSTSKYEIFGQTQVHLWTFCKEIAFFSRLVSLILKVKLEKSANSAEEDDKLAEKLLESAEKHYSLQKTQMIKLQIVKKLGNISAFLAPAPCENDKTQDFSSKTLEFLAKTKSLDEVFGPPQTFLEQDSLKLEEIQGKRRDIDNLRGFLFEKLNLKREKPATVSKTAEFLRKPEKSSAKNTENPQDIDLLRATASSLDIEKGFTCSKLLTLYPTRFIYEHVTKLDNLANSSEFQGNFLRESEKTAFSASFLLKNLVRTVISMDDHQKTAVSLKIRRNEASVVLFELFFREDGDNFERIVVNYLAKLRNLSKINDFENSALECGELVNAILQSFVDESRNSQKITARFRQTIVRNCQNYFDSLCKLLISVKNRKEKEFSAKNLEIEGTLTRLLLVETLVLMCKATNNEKNCLVNEINATLWHVLTLQFFAKKNSDIFQQLFVKLLEEAVKFGSEETLFNVLFKINLLGSLYNSYENFVRNEVKDKSLNVDGFLYYLRRIVEIINEINKVFNYFLKRIYTFFKE